eukprot:5777145-Pyramimonas_sp.AAC.1
MIYRDSLFDTASGRQQGSEGRCTVIGISVKPSLSHAACAKAAPHSIIGASVGLLNHRCKCRCAQS